MNPPINTGSDFDQYYGQTEAQAEPCMKKLTLNFNKHKPAGDCGNAQMMA